MGTNSKCIFLLIIGSTGKDVFVRELNTINMKALSFRQGEQTQKAAFPQQNHLGFEVFLIFQGGNTPLQQAVCNLKADKLAETQGEKNRRVEGNSYELKYWFTSNRGSALFFSLICITSMMKASFQRDSQSWSPYPS